MIFNNKEDIIQLTAEWKGERLPDGRPMVPQRVLRALKNMTLEEVWKPIFLKGYEFVIGMMIGYYHEKFNHIVPLLKTYKKL